VLGPMRPARLSEVLKRLVANSLCPGQKECTMRESQGQSGNSDPILKALIYGDADIREDRRR
jgi:hypothetical protein